MKDMGENGAVILSCPIVTILRSQSVKKFSKYIYHGS